MSNTNTDLVVENLQRSEYRDGDVLSAAALTGDAESNITAWLKHQTDAHTGGIVAGLLVSYDDVDDKVTVSPGAAIDPQGRMILVGNDLELSIESIEKELYCALWLKCETQEAIVAGSEFNRHQEKPVLEVSLIDPAHCECDNSISPGMLLAIFKKSDNEFIPVICCRCYVGAVGNRITAPSGRAQMILGPQTANDRRRFAIGVQAGPKDSIRDVITWESTGTIRFSTYSSLAYPPEKSDEHTQPPAILSIGAPSVYVKVDDILDPCAIWKKLISSNILNDLFTDCEQSILTTPPECLEKLKQILVRIINRFLRLSMDDLYTLQNGQYKPRVGDHVVYRSGQLLKVVNVDESQRTCELRDSADYPFFNLPWRDLLPLWPSQSILARFHNDNKMRLNISYAQWKDISGGLVCRLLLDEYLGDAIRPFPEAAKRGLYFIDSAKIETEVEPGRIHLVEFKKDDKTYKQLRITIPDPGKDNHPERYRCSIGTANCEHDPIPDLAAGEKAVWNQQTSRPRGILSVLANQSVDIHTQLNIYPNQTSRRPGLVLKLEPINGDASAASDPAVATPILSDAVVWNGQKIMRSTADTLTIDGSLKNLTDMDIDSLQIIVSVYGKGDTDHASEHTELALPPKQHLVANHETPIASLVLPPGTPKIVITTEAFKANTVIVSLLVMGVNRQDAIICTQYREEHPKP